MSKFEWIKDLIDGEEVKPIKNRQGYFITNKGRVFSTKSNKWLKSYKDGHYYWGVCLGRGPGRNSFRIHALVGKHFIPEWREGLDVCHKDETLPFPQVNFVENLWVGTRGENLQDAYDKKRRVVNVTPDLVKRLTEQAINQNQQRDPTTGRFC